MVRTTTDLRSEPVEAIDLAEARDRELVQGIRRRDEEAFRGLFGRYAPSATSLAMRVVRQSHLAEEIVQEAFMALWRNPRIRRRAGSVKSWLMGWSITAPSTWCGARSRTADAPRRRRIRRWSSNRITPMRCGTDRIAGGTTTGPRGARRAARGATRGLERMYFDGMSQSQIAEATGLPLGTVKSGHSSACAASVRCSSRRNRDRDHR
jgi:RNA polymerase sigma-70 factor (ECF subfamily)